MTERGLPGPTVEVEWLAPRLGEAGLVVVDGSWYFPAQNRSAVGEYLAGHIPGAAYADLDQLSDRSSPLPHMLPQPEDLGRAFGLLGIGHDDQVVVYDGSGVSMSAGRLWWMLRIAGHQRVAVLDGGIAAWRAAGHPVEAGWTRWSPRRYEVRYRSELIRSLDQVHSSIVTGSAQILDARSRGRFGGTEPEPRPGLRSGHLPGALNLPYPELTGPEGRLLSSDALSARFKAAGIDLTRPVITSCGSGVTACTLALGLELLGHRAWSVYDGSWSEWGAEGGPAIER
jgi:thiosulfate/3-mercaptopyruvate sulfurtransferase